MVGHHDHGCHTPSRRSGHGGEDPDQTPHPKIFNHRCTQMHTDDKCTAPLN